MKKLSVIQKEFQVLNHLQMNNWGGINYPSKIDDWEKFEKNNPTIAYNILYIKEKEIISGYILKHNSTCKKYFKSVLSLLLISNLCFVSSFGL